jgi:hypothetical protein
MRRTPLALSTLLLPLALPGAALAQGGTGSPPAGGGETGQVIGGTIGAAVVTGLMLAIVVGHRSGRLRFVGRLADRAERETGVPGWAALPLLVLGASLITAVFGMYWDIATHLDAGRDAGPFANVSHYFILVGLFGVFFAGLLAVCLPQERPGPAALSLPGGLQAPLGGFLILVCAAFALMAFPLDDMWHRIFGQDVTLWGPTHLVLFGAASLSTLGALILLAEGSHVARQGRPGPLPGRVRLLQVLLAGAFLIGLSTFQGEFDYAVPQFRLVWHPILLMAAASIALVTARVYAGRGGALGAVALFLVVRGALTLLVSPTFGHTLLHFPLYLVEALVVEAVALRVPRERPITLGLVAGALIGTVGLAAEWAWSYLWWTIEWPGSLLPEGALAGFVAAVAGGVVGGFIGRALSAGELAPRPVPRLALPAALAALVAVFVYAAPIADGERIRARVTLDEVSPAPQREVHVRVSLDPADAADGARWFNATAWQGQEGRSVVTDLRETSPGVFRTEKPVPVYGAWKTTLRLHRGAAVQGLAVYFPPDEAIPVQGTPAPPRFTREFVRDVKLLQREQKPDVPGWLVVLAYVTVLVIGLALYGSMGWGLRLLQRRVSADRQPADPVSVGAA